MTIPFFRPPWGRCLAVLSAVLAAGAFTATQARAGEYRTISAKLKNTTPLWYQTTKASGHPVGCGPAAWGIVLGYWKQHRGKGKLLDGITMPHPSSDAALAKHLEEIAGAVETTYGSYKGGKFGRTMPGKMDEVSKYIKKRGYTSTVDRERGTEFNKFEKVKASLDQDRPVIILMNDPEKALSSLHYAVIERAELKQKKVLGKWRDRDVRYYVNLGNGSRKWVWVREVGKDDHERTGSFSMFFLKFN